MRRGELFIVSAPSGTGKTTLIRRLLEKGLADSGKLVLSVSHTTREPRRGETYGRDYYFVSPEEFQGMIARDLFLEWAEVHGHRYGTSKAEVLPRLERGVDVLLDVDVQGAEQVLGRHPEATSIFILPPSYRDLKQRLRRRGLDSEQQIARRLAVSLSEIRHYERYEYVIVNDDRERAGEALTSIVLAHRHRRQRSVERVEEILRDFERSVEHAPRTAAARPR